MAAPQVTPFVEVRRDGGFIVSLGNGHQSFETGTLNAANSVAAAGLVVGKLTADGTLAAYNPTNTDGSQVPVGIVYGVHRLSAAAQPCVYVARQAEVNGAELVWFAGATPLQIATGSTALSVIGVLVR